MASSSRGQQPADRMRCGGTGPANFEDAAGEGV
jgi:hypothetical protein